MTDRRLRLALLASGAAGLVHEVAWGRAWTLVFGSGLASSAAVVAVYMVGLGLGARACGRISRWTGLRGRALFARLELGIAGWAALSPGLLAVADGWHLANARALGPTSPSLLPVRLLLVTAVLLPPTLLMGATLPAACHEVEDGEAAEAGVGELYAWNTSGAVLGIVLGSYLLIPELGLQATTFMGCALGLAAAALARGPAPRPLTPASTQTPVSAGPEVSQVEAVYAFVGFWALALEVLFVRAVLSFSGSSVYALAATLGSFLGGMAAGAALATRWLSGGPSPRLSLARRLAAAGAAALLSTLALPFAPELYLWVFGLTGGVVGGQLAAWAASVLLLLPTGVALGAIFPAATRCLLPLGGPSGAAGRAYFANSLGSAAGSLAAYWVLAPLCGVSGGLLAGAGALLLASAWLTPSEAGRREPGACLLLCLLLPAVQAYRPVRLVEATHRLTRGGPELALRLVGTERSPDVLYYRDGPDASVSVTRGEEGLALRINGKADAGLGADRSSQAFLGHLGGLLAPEGSPALMIGLGAGGSADALLRHGVSKVDVAELSPTVLEAARLSFRRHFPLPFEDPRSRLHVTDGRLLVRAWEPGLGAIVAEPTNLWISGVANLYTREFLSSCRRVLREDGVLVQWIQGYDLDREVLALVLRTACEVFPHVSLFLYGDLFLVASSSPIRLDPERTARELALPAVAASLVANGLPDTHAGFTALEAGGELAVKAWAGDGPVLTDDRPRIEFLVARNRFRFGYLMAGHLAQEVAAARPGDE